jgi:hypothetical protein
MNTNVTPTTAQKYLKLKVKRDYNGNNFRIFVNGTVANWNVTANYNSTPSSVWQDVVINITTLATAGTAITTLLIEPVENNSVSLGFPVTVCIDDVVLSETSTSRTATVATPTINISTATLSGFAYNYGSGPSVEQSYTVSGVNLINNIVVTPLVPFEISLTSGTGYQSTALTLTKDGSGNVATTTIYARLKAATAAGAYSNYLTNISIGATTQTVNPSGTVNLQSLTIAAASIASKVYNGNTTSGTVTSGTLSGFIGTETVTVGSAVGTSPDANVGTGKSATIVYTLANGTNGGLAANYSLANTTATGDITAKPLNIGTSTIASKVYDGTTTSGTVTLGTLSGFVSGETVTTTAVGTYPDANVGTGKSATIVYTLADGTGGLASNYSLANGSATGDITAATLNLNNAATTFNASDYTVPQLANSDLVVSAGEFVVDQSTATVKSLTVAPGAKLSVGSNTLTATNGITFESDATGTATLMDSYSSPTINATVKQYVTSGRNWYMSAPINNTASPLVLNRGASVQDYDEINGVWELTTGTLTNGKGYIQVASAGQGSTGTVSFNGSTNSGNVAVTLTNTPDKGKGFNLVGNPYPSYLSWSAVANNSINTDMTTGANMPTGTIWYRTISDNGKSAWVANTGYTAGDVVYNANRFYTATSSGTSDASSGPSGTGTGIADNSVVWDYAGSMYVFATVSLDGTATPSTVSNLIPPMQAFWVRSNGGTLTFTNAMRTHETVSNRLKAPKNTVNEMPLVRLKVTNGVSADEAVIYASTFASNALDAYDAPKYFNTEGSNQPEIYTQVGNEKLVINALNDLNQGTEIPLGFATERGSDFTISASELRNVGSDMQVLLKDKQTKTEFNLNDGKSYSFSSAVVNSTDRFSLIFRTTATTTGFNNSEKLNAQVFVNASNQITIIAPLTCSYVIYNTVGQKQYENKLNSTKTTIDKAFSAGVYFVTLSLNGQSEIQKIVIR